MSRTETTRKAIAAKIQASETTKKMLESKDIEKEILKGNKVITKLEAKFTKEKGSFKKYALFFEDKHMTTWGLSESFFFVLRRTIFIVSALYLVEEKVVIFAVAIFSLSSFLNLVYLLTAQPMLEPSRN